MNSIIQRRELKILLLPDDLKKSKIVTHFFSQETTQCSICSLFYISKKIEATSLEAIERNPKIDKSNFPHLHLL